MRNKQKLCHEHWPFSNSKNDILPKSYLSITGLNTSETIYKFKRHSQTQFFKIEIKLFWFKNKQTTTSITTTTKRRPFAYIILLFEQFNMLQLSVSLCLKCVLVIGHCGRRNIKVPSVKTPELTNVFP